MRQPSSLEERISRAVEKAMEIVRPDQHPGPMVGGYKMPRHKWQHVELCRERVAGAMRYIAGVPDWIKPAARHRDPGKRPQRPGPPTMREAQKREAVRCAFDLILDYGGREPTTTKNSGDLADLANRLYGAATGDTRPIRHALVVDWYRENWSSLVRSEVTDKSGRKRAARSNVRRVQKKILDDDWEEREPKD